MRLFVPLVARLGAAVAQLPLPLLALALALAGQFAVVGRVQAWHGWLLLVGGAALIGGVALDGGARRRPSPDGSTDGSAPVRADAEGPIDPAPERLVGGLAGTVSLLLVTGLAVAFRAPWLDRLPPGLAADEARLGLEAARFLASGGAASAWGGWPIFHVLTVGSVAALGQTVLALRMPAALAGVLFAPALFLLGRQLGGTRLGLVAGLLGAVAFWHVDLSRGAWGYAGWGPTAGTFGLALMVRTFRRPDPVLTAAAGLALGVALQATWAALAVLLAGGLLLALTPGLRFRTRRFVSAALAPFLVYLAVAAGPVLIGACVPDQRPAATEYPPIEGSATASAVRPPVATAVVRSLLAFNVAGDPGALHGLHGEPFLDPLTGALLALGLGIAVAYWRSAQLAAIVAWLAAAVVVAALTGRGTPPDGLASVHAVAPALLLAAVGVTAIAGGLNRHAKLMIGWSLDIAGVLLLAIVAINAHTLYVRRAADAATWQAYQGAETMAAREIRSLARTHAIYLADVWIDHPTLRFLVPEVREPGRIDPARTLPFPQDVAFAYFAPGSQEVVPEDLERLYEHGEIDRFRSPVEDDAAAFRSFRAPARVVGEPRGVTVRSYPTDRSRSGRTTVPSFDFEWPLAGDSERNGSIEAFAAVAVAEPGRYRLRLDGPPGSQLEVNGVVVGGPGQEIATTLAGGTQRLRVTAPVRGSARIALRWAPPGVAELTTIPPTRLFREQRAGLGLLAFYRPGSDPRRAPELVQVERYLQRDRLPPALARPYVVDWVGVLDAPKSGTYRFRIDASGPASLWLDDRPILLDSPPGSEPVSLILPEGDHRIQARLIDADGPTRFNLEWAPPGENFGAVPTLRLRPPDARVEAVALSGRDHEPPLQPLGAPRVRWLASTDGEPRAVTVGRDGGVYLANATSRRVQRVIGDGRDVDSLPAAFSVPTDLETGPDGAIWVLDAQRGHLVQLGDDGAPARTLTNADIALYRPRGFAIGPDGTFWIADTGGSRIVKLSADGVALARIGPEVGGPERIRQPTDVAVGPNGELFVVNGEGGALLRLDADGAYERHWTVLQADTERGAHLAIGRDRSLWVSEPEGRRISRFSLEGTPSGVIDVFDDARLFRLPVGIALGPDGTLYVADASLRAVVALTFGP